MYSVRISLLPVLRYCAYEVLKILGTIGCIWYICWLIVVRRRPSDDKYISKDELRYIQECLDSSQSKNAAHIKHPWKDIFTSKAVYAICASHFAENWGFYTMLTQLPTFLAGKGSLYKKCKLLNSMIFMYAYKFVYRYTRV